jgi:tricorn protease
MMSLLCKVGLIRVAWMMAGTVAGFVPALATAQEAPQRQTVNRESASQRGYYRWASIHDQTVVFNCEADLWSVPVSGGVARRLTSHPGNELFARISPDGSLIAFTGEYQGNGDVYVMPIGGGEPRRLTYRPERDEVVGWTPDGAHVLYRARTTGRKSEEMLYRVPLDGGQPEMIRIGPVGWLSYSPDGSRMAINQHSWMANWKRYRGGTAPEILVGDPSTAEFTNITRNDAVDQFPMWVGDRIYFVSERGGTANIYSCKADGSDVRQHTSHDELDVRMPQTDGKSIVYTRGADLYILDLATDQVRQIDVVLASDRVRQRPRVENAARTVDGGSLSHDGSRLVVSSRGELWTGSVKPNSRILRLTESSGTRERLPVFSPDGKRIACISDASGEQEVVIYPADGKGEVRTLTTRGKGWLFAPQWSPDSRHILYADLTGELVLVDVENGATRVMASSDAWEITDYAFSPDGKWIAYSRPESTRFNTIHIIDVASGSSTKISGDFTGDFSPAWDPEGKYLFFLSSRHVNPRLDWRDRNFIIDDADRVCCVILSKEGKSPLLPEELRSEPDEKEKADAKPQAAGDDAGADKPGGDEAATKPASAPATSESGKEEQKLPDVKIDLHGIDRRVIELPVEPGNYVALGAVKGKVFFVSQATPGLAEQPEDDGPPSAKGSLMVFDLEEQKTEEFASNVDGYSISGDASKVAFRTGDEIRVADASGKPAADLKTKWNLAQLPLTVRTGEEWRQIFADAWRLQRDFFWAGNMVGVDWEAMRKRYEPLVERVSTRGELNDVLGQLFGELGTSHTYVFGGDSSYEPPPPVAVGQLGADVELDPETGLFRFTRVYRAEPWLGEIESPLTANHVAVEEGNFLLAINGRELSRSDSVDERLAQLAGAQVALTVSTRADKSDAREVQVKALTDDSQLRYQDWCRRNREYVAEQTGGRVGYFHLPDMGGEGLVQFVRGFYPQVEKDALIIDARDNGGGFVSQMMLQRLARKPWAFGTPRRGSTYTVPERTHLGHKCVLINEHAGSDGDIFPDSFRVLGLGPLIGVRTWGGVVGIRTDKPFIDGGMSSQPEFAWWDAKRGWSLENVGVPPDIEVRYLPRHYRDGVDPQLDRAIEEMKKKLESEPVHRPVPPPFPDKTGRGPQ